MTLERCAPPKDYGPGFGMVRAEIARQLPRRAHSPLPGRPETPDPGPSRTAVVLGWIGCLLCFVLAFVVASLARL